MLKTMSKFSTRHPYSQATGAKQIGSSNRQEREEQPHRSRHKSAHVPDEAAGGMDQQELALQIQMYEALQAKHKAEKEKKGHTKEKKHDGQYEHNLEDFSTGFDHGFGKFDTNQQAQIRSSSSKPQSQPKKKEENKDNGNDFDFNFGGSGSNPPK